MAQRTLEEVFRTIAPPRRRGIPNPAAISDGFTSNTGDLTSSMSQVGTEIAQLRTAYQQQQDVIAQNTAALKSGTSSGGTSAAGTVGHVASGLFGGALGFLSPIVTGLLGLFTGGGSSGSSSTSVALPAYSAPPSIDINGFLRAPATPDGRPSVASPAQQQQSSGAAPQQQSAATNITVNVNAMDSQSFMDRSSDIASAVREAMLNNHPINGVVTDL